MQTIKQGRRSLTELAETEPEHKRRFARELAQEIERLEQAVIKYVESVKKREAKGKTAPKDAH